jgi:hypothetical protein
MNIEIVEFYPLSRDDTKQELKGSMHVYLSDFQLDLRGIHVYRKKNYWFFRLPQQWTVDPDTGEKNFFPVISFVSKDQNDQLIDSIRKAGIEYIEEKVLKNETCKQ